MMTAIPKALAMADPKQVVACAAAAAAGVIASEFATDGVANTTHDKIDDIIIEDNEAVIKQQRIYAEY